MMGRWLRRLAGLAIVLALVLLVLGYVAAKLLDGDRMREMVVEQVTAATGAQVSLGEAEVKVWPRLAVRLAAGRLTGTGAALAAAQGSDFGLVSYDAVIDRIEVRVALLPLLRKRIAVETVQVDLDRLEAVLPDDTVLAEQASLTVGELSLGVPAPPPATDPGEQVPPGLLIPEDIFCRADLTVGRLTAQEAVYNDLTVEAELDGRLLTADTILLRRAGGTVTGEAELDWEIDPWGELIFSFDTDGVPATALLEPWVPDLARRLETMLVGEGSGRCKVKDADTALATLSLTGRAGAGEGVLHAADWLSEITPYLGGRTDLVDVRFRELVHGYRIADGRYLVDDLAIDGLDTEWRGAGWLALDGQSMDLGLAVRLPAGFTPDLGQWSFLAESLRDEEGRVRLDLRLTGPTERPVVSVDLSQLKQAARDNPEETLKQGVGGLLDKWQDR